MTRRRAVFTSGRVGAGLLLLIALPCFVTLPWSGVRYVGRAGDEARALQWPTAAEPMGTDALGRSLVWRSLLGGAVSLGIGAAAAVVAVGIGVTWGAVAGYAGGATDAWMMRVVDVLYGLPYILLVVLLTLAVEPVLRGVLVEPLPGVVTLLVAIGAVSWLTMARVIRGQVLSLRGQPFVEAARAYGAGPGRVLARHVLPNLVGPIVVYATLTVPVAILQESFLSFLGIGVKPPLPSWGNLAAEGVAELPTLATGAPLRWWLLVFPCALLGLTLLGLNLLGDALRERLDPRATRR